MAFQLNNLVRWAPLGQANANTLLVNPLPIAPPVTLPQFWAYNAGNDSIATVEANGYFFYFADFTNYPGPFLQKGDLIYCVCSNGYVNLTVTAIGATITTEVTPIGALAAGSVLLANLGTGIAPEAVIKYSAQYTTVGGAAAEAIAVAGALATDLAFVQLVNHGPNTVSVAFAVMTANTLTVTFSANPGAGAIINYQIIRTAS